MSPTDTGLGPQATGAGARLPDPPLVDVGGRTNEQRFKMLWAGVLAVVLIGLTLSAYSEYRTATDHAHRAVADSALVLKQHMRRHFEGADLLMRYVSAEVARHGWSPQETEDGASTLGQALDLSAIAEETDWVDNLWLVGAEGSIRHVLRPGEMPPATLASVQEAAAGAMATPGIVHLGKPVAGQFLEWPAFIVARAIPGGPRGEPMGAVVTAIAGDSLADVFSQQVLGPRGTVALVRGDGMVIAGYPSVPGASGGYLREGPMRDALRAGTDGGTLRGEALPDGRDRIISFAHVDGLPLAAVASHAVADLRAGLVSSLWPQYLLAGLLVIGLAGFYPFMIRRLRFEQRAARDLAERELLFRSILNNVGVGLGLVAADGTLRFANTVFDRLLGYEPGGLTGRNVEDLTHPDDRLSTMYRVSRMEALGPSGLSYEKRYIRRDGTFVEAQVTLSLKPRVGEQEPLMVGVIQDLTEQRARERAIAFQNSLLRIQQEASPDALLVTDNNGRVRSWNTRFRTMWGLHDALLSDGVVLPVLRHIAAHVAPATPQTYGEADLAGWLRRKLKDGRTIDTLETELRDGTGAAIGHVWFFRDVSERLAAEAAVRESEARYRALVEQSPEAIMVYRDDRVLFANSAARALFGYEDRATWPEAASVSAMVAPGLREHVRSAIRNSTMNSWNGIQEDLRRRDGSLFDAWIISAPIRVQDMPAAQAVIRPLDAGQGVRGRLMQTAKMATLGQMAASVAHELSQPLNILSMGLEGLRLRQSQDPGGPSAEELNEKLEIATRQCGRMAEIIDHIRVFSRSSTGKRVPFDAAGPLRAAIDMMRPVFEREGIDLNADLPARAGTVEGSPLDLEQVVINLLKNAFDAIGEARETDPTRPARVTVVARAEPDERQLMVEVADTGPGIPETLFEDIFEPFFTTKKEGVGTGLGLSICMSTIAKMGGTLRPDNRDGAVFTVRLPLTEDAAVPTTDRIGVAGMATTARPAVILDQGAPSTPPATDGPTGHVLLVEPDAATRQALAVILIEWGFRVTTAGSPAEAAGKARLDPPRVLLSALPLSGGEDAPDLLRRLRHWDQTLTAVLLAADPTSVAEAGAAAMPGVVAVLARPVEAARLLAALRAALAANAETAAP